MKFDKIDPVMFQRQRAAVQIIRAAAYDTELDILLSGLDNLLYDISEEIHAKTGSDTFVTPEVFESTSKLIEGELKL